MRLRGSVSLLVAAGLALAAAPPADGGASTFSDRLVVGFAPGCRSTAARAVERAGGRVERRLAGSAASSSRPPRCAAAALCCA